MIQNILIYSKLNIILSFFFKSSYGIYLVWHFYKFQNLPPEEPREQVEAEIQICHHIILFDSYVFFSVQVSIIQTILK